MIINTKIRKIMTEEKNEENKQKEEDNKYFKNII